MEFRFTRRNCVVKVNCSKILLKEIIMHKGDFRDIVLLFIWESTDSRDGEKKDMKYEVIPESFPNGNVLNDEEHFILFERWPNSWFNFRKNIDGISITYSNKAIGKKLSDLEFTLVFETT
jgi:hypothetical protein